jgi:hypothetical protein
LDLISPEPLSQEEIRRKISGRNPLVWANLRNRVILNCGPEAAKTGISTVVIPLQGKQKWPFKF